MASINIIIYENFKFTKLFIERNTRMVFITYCVFCRFYGYPPKLIEKSLQSKLLLPYDKRGILCLHYNLIMNLI